MLKSVSFATSYATYYIKGLFEFHETKIRVVIPNTVLTFIPAGKRERTLPIDQISSVDTNSSFIISRFLIGLLIILFGFADAPDSILGDLILIALGAVIFLSGFVNELIITVTSGQALIVPLVVFERKKASEIKEMIDALVSQYMYDRNVRVQNVTVMENDNRNTDRIIDAINKKQ